MLDYTVRLRGWCKTCGTAQRLIFGVLCLGFAARAQSFHAGVLYPTQNGPMAAATADFNGDGKLDLAVANAASSSVTISLGKGDGSFNAGATVAVPGNCLVTGLVAGDFNGDGKADLLAICGFQTTIWVLPGLGSGQFGAAIATHLPQLALMGFGIEVSFQGAAVADLNGDGKLDLAIGLGSSDLSSFSLDLMLGKGDGTFGAPSPVVSTSAIPANVVAADLDGDGKQDLVVTFTQLGNPPVSSLMVLRGDGKGSFQQIASYPLATINLLGFIVVADVNGDGIPDLIVAGLNSAQGNSQNVESTLTVFIGTGGGSLRQTFSATEQGLLLGLLAADFRGTGTPDLIENIANAGIFTGGGATILNTRAGNKDGTFQNPVTIPLPAGLAPFWLSLLAADWNGDGLPDLAFVSLPPILNMNLSNVSGNGLAELVPFVDGFPQGNLVVMLNAAPPLIVVSNPQLQFSYTAGGSAPPSQAIAVSSARNSGVNWTAAATVPWLKVSPASGTVPASITVSVTAELAANTYTGAVKIVPAGAVDLPLTVPVTLVVSAATVGPNITAVLNGASFQAGFEAGSWVTIKGTNLANTNPGRIWRTDEVVNGVLPTSLDGVSVTIDGLAAYVYYISPTQINVQAPSDGGQGQVNVVVKNNGTASAAFPATLQPFAPAFFQYTLTPYAIATRYPDNALIGNPSVIPGTVAAKPGDVLILWATGFGPTDPPTPAGIAVTGAPKAATLPSITVGGVPVTTIYAVLSPGSAGLYQIAVQLPASLPAGIAVVQASIGGVQSPGGVDLLVGN
jgi:uncharacterized protein (TIGR03437 family)